MNVGLITRIPQGSGARPQPSPPSPLSPTLSPPLDLEGLLHLAQLDRRKNQQESAESDVRTAQGKRNSETHQARIAAERADAEARASAEKAHSAAFWKKCAAYAGVVASVAATVASCGSAAPLAVVAVGVALSLSSPYIGQGAAKLTGNENVGRWTTVTCAVAGAIVQTVGSGGAGATGTVATVAHGTQRVASAAAAGSSMVEGYRTKESKDHESDAEHLRADGVLLRGIAQRRQSELDEVVEQLKGLESSISRALDAVAGAGRELEAGRQRAAMHLGRSC